MPRTIFMTDRLVPESEAKISVFDHGLLYGDGVFEGLRAYAGKVFRLEAHVDRLFASARAICLEIPLSKAAVAGFKLRENLPIGCKVTLRGRRMYEFLDRLVSLALPRVRDFRGLSSTAFDGHGNYSLGLSEQMVFPEINPDKYTRPQRMNITLVTSAKNDDEAREFLRAMGVPLKKDGDEGAAA